MMRICLGLVALTVMTSTALAADMITATPKSLAWGEAPDAFPKGGKIAVLAGDPTKSGPFVLRFKAPNGYKFAAHNHPTTENVTVISGTFHIAAGDKLDLHKSTALKTGSFLLMPAKMNHYGWATTPTILQIEAEGPFAITYVNPADDPRTKK